MAYVCYCAGTLRRWLLWQRDAQLRSWKVNVAMATVNEEAGRRLRQLLSSRGRRRRHYITDVTPLQMLFLPLLLCSCCSCIYAAAAADETVAMVADDATTAELDGSSASLFGNGRPASLDRRDLSSGRDRGGTVDRRASIAAPRPPGPGGRGRGEARPRVVNKVKPSAAATRQKPGRVNVTPVITTTVRQRSDRPPRILIRPLRPSLTSVQNALGTSSHQSHDNYLPTQTVASSPPAGDSFQQFGNESVQPISTHRKSGESSEKFTSENAAVDDNNAALGSSIRNASLPGDRGVRVLRRKKRRSEESVESDRQTPRNLESPRTAATSSSVDGTSTESPAARSGGTREAGGPAAVPMGASALRYRSRSNFAALVDPLSGGGRALASGKKWRHLTTVSDSPASSVPITEEPTVTASSATGSYDDSVEIKVLRMDVGDSENATAFVASRASNDGSKSQQNSTLSPSGERNCSKSAINGGLALAETLRSRLSSSAAAAVIYSLAFLFAIVAASATIGAILSPLRMRNRRLSSSQLVLGSAAIAAAARALYYLDSRYPLVATSAARRAIYECFFPLLVAAFFAHGRLLCGKAPSTDSGLSSAEIGRHTKRSWLTGFRCDLCVFGLLWVFYIVLVVSLCLLIEFCVVPVEAAFVLRLVFALFAVLLSIRGIATSSGRHIATQVVLRALFAICATFSVVDAATLLSSDLAPLFRQNAEVWFAVEAAGRLAELFASTLLCASSSSTFAGFEGNKGRKSAGVGRTKVPGTTVDDRKVVKCRQASALSAKSPQMRQSSLSRLFDCWSKKAKVLDVGSATPQMSSVVLGAVGWASTEDVSKVDRMSPLPLPPRVTRSR